ncbi:hypothetical protein D0809_08935 [Flavobacterium circumlabens]|uniref:Uncharacterized protein n=1 Tax=Flavobacterium circumlabens TaxID=2133765 RepID=A0A4Y7UHB2_9FLAO|nr:hypothetical protein [Flavobacterium circumlabens]TCN60044.1 hypothetical protein EV142_102664 [Flavobacterium circumlabens]TEB45278.1 hypothetical protein D0809_08935 [Flavobacterium circumlabens]
MTKIADQLNNGSISSGENVSFWINSTSIIAFNTPDQNNDTEVLVTGIGKTSRTTANLTCALDDRCITYLLNNQILFR